MSAGGFSQLLLTFYSPKNVEHFTVSDTGGIHITEEDGFMSVMSLFWVGDCSLFHFMQLISFVSVRLCWNDGQMKINKNATQVAEREWQQLRMFDVKWYWKMTTVSKSLQTGGGWGWGDEDVEGSRRSFVRWPHQLVIHFSFVPCQIHFVRVWPRVKVEGQGWSKTISSGWPCQCVEGTIYFYQIETLTVYQWFLNAHMRLVVAAVWRLF